MFGDNTDYVKSNSFDTFATKGIHKALGKAIIEAENTDPRYRTKIGQMLIDDVCIALHIPSVKLCVVDMPYPHRTNDRGKLAGGKLGHYKHIGSNGIEIRIWNRTAMKAQRTSNKGFLNTLIHEINHHLDCAKFGITSSPHTSGFYKRITHLSNVYK